MSGARKPKRSTRGKMRAGDTGRSCQLRNAHVLRRQKLIAEPEPLMDEPGQGRIDLRAMIPVHDQPHLLPRSPQRCRHGDGVLHALALGHVDRLRLVPAQDEIG